MSPNTSLLFCFNLFCIIIITQIQSNEAANILFFHPISSKSHLMVTWPFARALVSKGHSVTYISVCEPPIESNSSSIPVIIPAAAKETIDSVIELYKSVSTRKYINFFPPYFAIPLIKVLLSDALFSSQEFQDWIKSNPKVDLIIVDSIAEFGLALANKLNSKVVVFSPVVILMELLESTGVPAQVTSTMEHPFPSKDSAAFFSRAKYEVARVISSNIQQLGNLWLAWNTKKYLNLEYTPSLNEQFRNISLVLYNGFPFEEHKNSFPPNFIGVGGIHIKEKNESLSKEINDFIGNSPRFIYISLGTVADVGSLPKSTLEAFMEAIRSFPEIKFLWKWDVQRPEQIPPNLYLAKWFSQQDILSDSRIIGFITQAGRPSLQESLYHGVPMITFPILGDQDYNALMLEELGVSINLEILAVSPQQLISSISMLISSQEKFKFNALRISKIIRDVPMKPLETAVWWTEYVLRHESTSHLQSIGIGNSFLFKKNADVWIFVFLLLGTATTASYYFTRRFFHFIVIKISRSNSRIKQD